MLRIHTGYNRLLAPALIAALQAPTDAERQLVVVPKQLTLQTERTILKALNLRGSFQIQVLSAERLCARIFDETGLPEGARIDERGRVLLARAAVRAAAERLTLYRGAERRRGFSERAAVQLERLRQASITPETLRACADELRGTAAMKLNDLSYILEAYEALTEGKYLDGEAEFNAAIAHASNAAFLQSSDIFFYGFDMMPPTLHNLIATLGALCANANLFLPLENDADARDFDCYLPMQRALERLCHAAKLAGAQVERVMLGAPEAEAMPAAKRPSDLVALERELFAFPLKPIAGAPRHVQVTTLRNPNEECLFAAALARRLACKRGYHWSEIVVLCRDIEAYSQPLRTAFDAYQVPLVLSSSRSAARHALSECLLTALRCIEKNYPAEDMIALMHTGFMPLQGDDAERFANYAVRTGLRGQRFLRPLRRGSEEELTELEPLRARLAEPLLRLRDGLRAAAGLSGQLTALFDFLTGIRAQETCEARQARLIDAGLRALAGEESQVWNRILGALDQMHALMGAARLSMRELSETLSQSLAAAHIKALPQSGDSVYAQPSTRMCPFEARALIILGASDAMTSDDEGLLSASQRQTLSSFAHAYLGPDSTDLSRLNRFYMKSALGMAAQYVSVSCPMTGADGAAQRPGAVIEQIAALFPELKMRGGLLGDKGTEQMLRGAHKAAFTFVARALAGELEGQRMRAADRAALAGLRKLAAQMPDARQSLRSLMRALNRRATADSLRGETARDLYGAIHHISVTQLELFANCPFAYFARYGLKPERIEPFELNARDEGSFFHSAVSEFLLRSLGDLNALDGDEATRRMDGIADTLLDAMQDGPLGDTARSLAERRRLKSTVCACARALAAQMRGSQFKTTALEQSFGRGLEENRIELPDGCVLEGRIDRIDEWSDYLRVIDFKRGGKALKLPEAYYGLRLQLPVYLAASMKRRGAKSAGVYYFPVDEDFLNTQSVDPHEIEAERRKALRMEGLLPSDMELVRAMSPSIDEVVKVRLTKNGQFFKGTLCADQSGFDALANHAVRAASAHLQDIRAGNAEIAPAMIDQKTPCVYCDYRRVCLFDERLDAGCVRKMKPLSPEEALERIVSPKDPDSQ